MADLSTLIPSPSQLRALSHPVRLRILGILRLDGPATATTLAERLGLNTGATSYHLRSLHQHGFILEDAGRGNGRERWWRAAHKGTRTGEDIDATPEGREAIDAFLQTIAVIHTDNLQRAIESHSTLPDEWREASTMSDTHLRVTAAQAKEMTDALVALMLKWKDAHAEGTPNFEIQIHAFPRPGAVESA